MYKIQLSPTAAASYGRLHPEIKSQVRAALKELGRNPFAGKELQHELAQFRTLRIRRYRVIYRVDADKVIKIFMVGHRREIYELMAELVDGRTR